MIHRLHWGCIADLPATTNHKSEFRQGRVDDMNSHYTCVRYHECTMECMATCKRIQFDTLSCSWSTSEHHSHDEAAELPTQELYASLHR